LSFRYSPVVDGVSETYTLLNYDSKFSELFEDSFSPNYTVNADLELVDIKALATDEDFYYGNEVLYEFGVQDALSKAFILPDPEVPSSTAYLVLSHLDVERGRKFQDELIPAKFSDGTYKITW